MPQPTLKTILEDPRLHVRRGGPPDPDGRCVLYWMQRAQRALDNPALNAAVNAGNALGLPVLVFLGLRAGYPGANRRHYTFMAEGVPGLASALKRRRAPLVLEAGSRSDLLRICSALRPALVVGDENPLREPASWRDRAARRLNAPFWTVDADVVVPSGLFPKEEYAARTLRPKLHAHLNRFLIPPGNPEARIAPSPGLMRAAGGLPAETITVADLMGRLRVRDEPGAGPVRSYRGGTAEALALLRRFIRSRLGRYDSDRNKPDRGGTSELSAYLHFGQIGPHTVALAVREADAPAGARDAFLEELIVRRELAVNFVARNPHYDRLAGCPRWARATLQERKGDPRAPRYTMDRLERARTADPIWNAAQIEMVETGRMHGYMRMYWAKKILEWTRDPEEAFERAVTLNDRYELDGRDPNGYAGVAWAVGGKHDRPWGPRRPVYGLIRCMTASGISRKIDVEAYVERSRRLREAGAGAAPPAPGRRH